MNKIIKQKNIHIVLEILKHFGVRETQTAIYRNEYIRILHNPPAVYQLFKRSTEQKLTLGTENDMRHREFKVYIYVCTYNYTKL